MYCLLVYIKYFTWPLNLIFNIVDFTELSQIDFLYHSVSQIDSSFWVNLGASN